MKRGISIRLAVAGLAVLLAYGCDDDDAAGPNPNGMAGEAGSDHAGESGGGTDTHGGAGGSGGEAIGGASGRGGDAMGGGGAGGEGGQPGVCGQHRLSTLCAPRPQGCPASPDDVEMNCKLETVERFASSCGGTIVRLSDGLMYTITYTFNADDELTGAVLEGDVAQECPDGSSSTASVYGENCTPEGDAEVLCAGGAGGAGGGAGL